MVLRPHKEGGVSDGLPIQGGGYTYIKYLEDNCQVVVFQNRFVVVQYCQLVTCTSGEWVVSHGQTHVANCFTRPITACCVHQTQLHDTNHRDKDRTGVVSLQAATYSTLST